MVYAELHAHSAYTFQEGAQLPHEMVRKAKELGLSSIGILDVDGFYSAIQTAVAANEIKFPVVYGSELTLASSTVAQKTNPRESLRLPVLVQSQRGYQQLCSAISQHNLQVPGRQSGAWSLEELAGNFFGEWKILTGTTHGPLRKALTENGLDGAKTMLDRLVDLFGRENVLLESMLRFDDPPELAQLLGRLAEAKKIMLVATGASRCSGPEKQALADVLAASRLNQSIEQAQANLLPFGTFLRNEEEMLKIHHLFPEAVTNSGEIAAQCSFDLSLMKPELPQVRVPAGHDDDSWLRFLTYEGAKRRYGEQASCPHAWRTIDHELKIIAELGFSGYFLIVKDIVEYCRQQDILCQGRGSAANSAVCFALGITPVDAVKHKLMFERFLSPERAEAPDIDIDIEAKRREEVIQYVYRKYGRENAAQVANVVSYRPLSALRTAGKALGYSEVSIEQWAKGKRHGWKGTGQLAASDIPIPPILNEAATALQKLPRHMSIHPAGVVLTKTPVSELCPVMWAKKEKRSVLQWDKDDCAEAGLVKFDLLGLGMLTALRKCFTWLDEYAVKGTDGMSLGLYNLPEEDQNVYDLLCAAETVGVFQVESRAQMSTLPRLRPREFYDLVIEVALIRPGPIQGNAVNPYLRRRNGREAAKATHPSLDPILQRTMGVPLFQEQLMQLVVEIAGFSAAEADELRRALGSKRSDEKMKRFIPRLYQGMQDRGIPAEVQDNIYDSLKGFAEFGFPESHAFSFAYLVYASAWLKVYFPQFFYAALLSSQPMGFYSQASIIADAKRHGIEILPPSVTKSAAKTKVEVFAPVEVYAHPVPENRVVSVLPQVAVRLGLSQVKGVAKTSIERIIEQRNAEPFYTLQDFVQRTYLPVKQFELLAQAGVFDDLQVSRRAALWAVGTAPSSSEVQPYIPGTEMGTEQPTLPGMSLRQQLQADYQSMGLTTGEHPLLIIRKELTSRRILTVMQLAEEENDRVVEVAGIVTHRQRPGTSKNVTFISLEDETGMVNVVCTVGMWRRYGKIALTADALVVKGRIERQDGALSLVAQKFELLDIAVKPRSRDFR